MNELVVYLKWPLVLLVIGFIFRTVGSLVRILHWANADRLLMIGTAFIVVAAIWIIVKLIKLKKEPS